MGRTYKISVLPGDGVGREVTPQALRVMKSAAEKTSGFELDVHEFEVGGEYFLREKREWSQEAEEFTKSEADAVLLGAVGANHPNGKPVLRQDGHLAGYSIVIGLRLDLQLFANVRPVKLYEGVPTPLAEKTHRDIDMVMIRENTEGLYARQDDPSKSADAETVIDKRVITRNASRRVTKYAFEQAMKRNGAPIDGVKRVTCVDKSNLLAGCQLFRNSFDEMSKSFPEVATDYAYVDAFTQWVIRKPEFYDVVVAPNEFGDIITDLGGAIQGGLGMAPAGSIGFKHAVFEPVHGSAPKHYGKGISNPIASILSSAMLLKWIGDMHEDESCRIAGGLIERGVEKVLRDGRIRTYDLCQGLWSSVTPASTQEVTDAIITSMNGGE
ncbi:MAG: isocitrate/isopropylmalate dehydrogenase family protein [Candidatus Thorarchaeota archaeon]